MLFPRLPNSKSSSASLKRAGNGDLLGLPSCVPLRLPFSPQAQWPARLVPGSDLFGMNEPQAGPGIVPAPQTRANTSQSGPSQGKAPSFPCSWLRTHSGGSDAGWCLCPRSFFLVGSKDQGAQEGCPSDSGFWALYCSLMSEGWQLGTFHKLSLFAPQDITAFILLMRKLNPWEANALIWVRTATRGQAWLLPNL